MRGIGIIEYLYNTSEYLRENNPYVYFLIRILLFVFLIIAIIVVFSILFKAKKEQEEVTEKYKKNLLLENKIKKKQEEVIEKYKEISLLENKIQKEIESKEKLKYELKIERCNLENKRLKNEIDRLKNK